MAVYNLISIFLPGINAMRQEDSQFLAEFADNDLRKVSRDTLERAWGSRYRGGSHIFIFIITKYARRDSNPQPMVPKTIALSS